MRSDGEGGRWWPLAVTVLVMGAGIGLKLSCLGPDGLTLAEAAVPWCYSDVAGLYQGRALGDGPLPYRDVMTEYPPLTALQWWVAGAWSSSVTGFYLITAVIQAAAAATVVALLIRLGLPTARVLLVAAAPALLLVGTVNWDLVAVALMVAGLFASQADLVDPARIRAGSTDHAEGGDRRAVVSGMLLGAGGLAKVFPLVAVPVLAWTAARTGRRRWAAVHVVSATTTVLAVQLPVALWAPQGWTAWIDLQRERPVDWDTIWYGLQVLMSRPLPSAVAEGLIVVTSIAGVVAIVAVGRRRAPGTGWRLLLPLLAWLLLVGKVYSPQYSLWLLPLLALSRAPLPLAWAWLAADAAVTLTRFPFLAGQQGGGTWVPYWPFGLAVAVRAALLVLLILAVVRPGPSRRDPGVV